MLLVGNGQVITRNPEQPYLKDGAVLIDGEEIRKVGPFEELKKEYPDAEFVDARGGIIMPGLINAHIRDLPAVFPSRETTRRIFWKSLTEPGGLLTAA